MRGKKCIIVSSRWCGSDHKRLRFKSARRSEKKMEKKKLERKGVIFFEHVE